MRFSKYTDNTVHLPYEIEYWNNTDTAFVWVLADSVMGEDSLAYITMHWQKAGAADSSDGEAVFEITKGFEAVLHLNEDPSGLGADDLKDATGSGHHGTPFGPTTPPALTTGAVGNAIDLTGPDAEGQKAAGGQNSADDRYKIQHGRSRFTHNVGQKDATQPG